MEQPRPRTPREQKYKRLRERQPASRTLPYQPKTARKWQQRDHVEDLPCGCRPGQGSVLDSRDEAVIVEMRRKTLLPLDDLYDLLKPEIPVLTRSNLHRCLQRHGVSRLKDLLPPEERQNTKNLQTL